MADQFNDSIPAVTNQITEDVADIAETLGYLKDVFQNFCYNWANDDATGIFPNVMDDDDEVLINIAGSEVISVAADEVLINISGSEVISVTATGYDVLGVPQGLDVTAALHRKIVEIGDWNMQGATNYVDVAHGLTHTKIRAVSALIRKDDEAVISNLEIEGGSSIAIKDTVATLSRKSLGIYDDANYNATSYNRGWILIDYVD